MSEDEQSPGSSGEEPRVAPPEAEPANTASDAVSAQASETPAIEAQPSAEAPGSPAKADPVSPAAQAAAPDSSEALDGGWGDDEEALPLVPKADKAERAAKSSPAASESETLYALEEAYVHETTGQSDPPIPIEVEGVARIESRPPPMLG